MYGTKKWKLFRAKKHLSISPFKIHTQPCQLCVWFRPWSICTENKRRSALLHPCHHFGSSLLYNITQYRRVYVCLLLHPVQTPLCQRHTVVSCTNRIHNACVTIGGTEIKIESNQTTTRVQMPIKNHLSSS